MTSTIYRSISLGVLLLACWLISGCANVPRASIDDDRVAKSFPVPKEGKSSLYLVRNTTYGQPFRLELSINGLPVALTAPQTYVKYDLPPGRYFIGSRGENYDQLPILLVEGRNHYVWQRTWIGWADMQTELIELSEADGKAAVLESTMVKKLVEDKYLVPMATK